MFPANLDTKEGQAAAIRATGAAHTASIRLHEAARYMSAAHEYLLDKDKNAEQLVELAFESLDRALEALGYRMVPGYLPTVESVIAERDEALAQMAALWEPGRAMMRFEGEIFNAERHGRDPGGDVYDARDRAFAQLDAALCDTADAAKRYEAEVRKAALEEAAAIADANGWQLGLPHYGMTQTEESRRYCADMIAASIRALIDKEPGHE